MPFYETRSRGFFWGGGQGGEEGIIFYVNFMVSINFDATQIGCSFDYISLGNLSATPRPDYG